MKLKVLVMSLVLATSYDTNGWSQDSARVTPSVKVIQQIQAGVVPIFTATNSAGTGAVFHESGYILTADHVTTNAKGLALFGLHRADYEIVGRVPERDLAVLKVSDLSALKTAIRIGRSNDLQLGEPIIVGGNPGGRGIVYSQGIINAASIEPSWPNILVKSFWRNETDDLLGKRERSTGGRPDFIQFDATTNKGNSGGPVVNFDGALIGLAVSKSTNEEGTNWGIPVDRIRMLMPYLIPAEEVGGFEVGLQVDMLGDQAVVMQVLEGSSAWEAGIRSGDVIQQVDQQRIRQGHEWLIGLWGRKAGDRVSVSFSRGSESKNVPLELRAASVESLVKKEDKVPGVHYELYDGLYPSIPNYETLESVTQGIVEKVDLNLVDTSDKRSYSIVYSGHIDFPEASLLRIGIGSDDGSKLYINGNLVIDNDLAHGFQTLTRGVRVPKGLVPFRVEYIEVGGDRGLALTAAYDMEGKRPVDLKFFAEKLD
jgi:S1-C subfamily serine protease